MRTPIIEDVTNIPLHILYEANVDIIRVWPRVDAVIGYVETTEVWR